MSFLSDRKIGQQGENLVREMMEGAGFKITLPSIDNRKFYDLECFGHDLVFRIEIKNDIKAHTTGNIALEIGNTKTGQKSGLEITKAEIWAHIIGGVLYLSSPLILLKHLKKSKPEGFIKKVVGAGDGNADIILLVASIALPLLFKSLKDTSPEEIKKIIQKLLEKFN